MTSSGSPYLSLLQGRSSSPSRPEGYRETECILPIRTNHIEVPSVEANGISIYYEIHGEGAPLVIIAGLSMDLTALDSIVSRLSQKHQVIVSDNRGAGRTDKPDIPYSIEMMAEDTAGLLNALGVGRADMMGISMGGRIAITLALKYPGLMKSLILVSTGPRIPHTLARRLLLSVLLEIPRRIGALGKKHPQPYYAYVHQREASQDYDATGRLHEIHVPTLILQGENDRLAPYKWAEEMHVEIHGSKIIGFKGGHMFLFWRQKEFLNAVEDFLDSPTAQPQSGL
jgi:3-oxoadipate enol-lactonase